jgi:tetraacyldisaccharide 4'-kinase
MQTQNLIQRHLLRRSILSYLLFSFSVLNAFLQIMHRKYYQWFPSRRKQFKPLVISIGNIVSGGSGKTPFTLFLAGILQKQGFKLAVSHRGYKGAFERENRLISNRTQVLTDAPFAGDEAYLLAEKLSGIPVVVGKNRSVSLQILQQNYPDLDIVLLDDSFQHLQVAHDLEIVLFQASVGLGNGFLLPAGFLREPVSALKSGRFPGLDR